jgi:hypothetical protein
MRGVVERRTENELAEALDQCIELLHSGATVKDCIQRFPSLRDQLEPLLAVAAELRRMAQMQPSPEFRRAAKARLLVAAVQRRAEPAQRPAAWWRSWSLRFAAAAAAVIVLAVPALSASADSLPGSPLFPIKRAMEEARLRLAPDAAAQAQVHLDIARARLRELETLRQRGQSSEEAARGLALALGRLEEHLRARSDTQSLPPGLVEQIEELSERLGVQQDSDSGRPDQPRGQTVRALAAQARELRELAKAKQQGPASAPGDHTNRGRGRGAGEHQGPVVAATATPQSTATAPAAVAGSVGHGPAGRRTEDEDGTPGRGQARGRPEDEPANQPGRQEEPRGQDGRRIDPPRGREDDRGPARAVPGRTEGQQERSGAQAGAGAHPAPPGQTGEDQRTPGLSGSGPPAGGGPGPDQDMPRQLRGQNEHTAERHGPPGQRGGPGASQPDRAEPAGGRDEPAQQGGAGRETMPSERGREDARRGPRAGEGRADDARGGLPASRSPTPGPAR